MKGDQRDQVRIGVYSIVCEYRRLRNLAHPWSADAAYRAATIRHRFTELEDEGLVRFKVIADDDYESALDFDGTPAQMKECRERANRDGVWGIETEYFDGSHWVFAASCWGFIGDDWQGQETDTLIDAIEALADDGVKAYDGHTTYAFDTRDRYEYIRRALREAGVSP